MATKGSSAMGRPTPATPAGSASPSIGEAPAGNLLPDGRVTRSGGIRSDIQGLRALAVLLVIGNHAGVPGFAGGFVGVDVFFVISGYVITQLLLREARNGARLGLSDFYSRRVRRIVPAATATLVATLVVGGVVLGARLDPGLPGDVRWASLFAANLRFIATGSNYFVPGVHPSLIIQFWSLGVEEQFYLVFPALVFGIWRLVSPARRRAALSATLVLGVAASAWWSVHLSAAEPVAAYYSPLTRFWELGLGCLLATLTSGRPRRSARGGQAAAALGVGLLVAALATLNSSSVFPGLLAWLPVGSAALIVWAGSGSESTTVTRLLSGRPLGYVGDLSYSLYLVHYAWLEIPKQLMRPLVGPGWTLLELAGTALSAVVLHHLLENPIRRSRRLASDHLAVLLVLCVCVAACWTQAVLTQRLLGLP